MKEGCIWNETCFAILFNGSHKIPEFTKIAAMAISLKIDLQQKPKTTTEIGSIFNLNMVAAILDGSHYQKFVFHSITIKDRILLQTKSVRFLKEHNGAANT